MVSYVLRSYQQLGTPTVEGSSGVDGNKFIPGASFEVAFDTEVKQGWKIPKVDLRKCIRAGDVVMPQR